MSEQKSNDDEIWLVDLVAAIWQRKEWSGGMLCAGTAAGVIFAFAAPETYRAEALLAPSALDQRQSLPAGVGGLANLVGINVGTSKDSTEAIATLRSRAFVEAFISDSGLLPVLFADDWDPVAGRWKEPRPEDWPDIADAVDYFVGDIRSVTEDSRTGFVTLSVEWTDPNMSAAWVDDLILRINEELRARDLKTAEQKLVYLRSELEKTSLVELRSAIAGLIEQEIKTIALANAVREYAFKVIDPPRVPHKHAYPRRALIIASAALGGGLVGAFVALFLWAFRGPKGARVRQS